MNQLNPRDYFSGQFKRKEDSEFEDEYEVQTPSLPEVRFLGNKQKECN